MRYYSNGYLNSKDSLICQIDIIDYQICGIPCLFCVQNGIVKWLTRQNDTIEARVQFPAIKLGPPAYIELLIGIWDNLWKMVNTGGHNVTDTLHTVVKYLFQAN